jgi:hypothetical protein
MDGMGDEGSDQLIVFVPSVSVKLSIESALASGTVAKWKIPTMATSKSVE